MATHIYPNCPCCGSSSSSSSKSISSSSSSSAFNCPACLNCLAVDFGSGLISTKTGCVGTWYGTIDGLPGLITNSTVITNPPNCNVFTFTGSQFTGTIRTNTNPPIFQITFGCGSPNDTATYTKVNTSACILGSYMLTSRTQPSYAFTWPPTIDIVSTSQFIPSSAPSSMTITWSTSIAEPGCVTAVTVPITYTSNLEFGKPTDTFTANKQFISNPGTVLVNDWGAGINWGCRAQLFCRLFPLNPPPFSGSHWTGDTSYVFISGGNPNRTFPASGTVYRANIPNMVPRLFAGGVTVGDFTITY